MQIFEPGNEITKQKWPEQPFFLEPYIPKESVVLFYGRAGIGKSAVTFQMAQAIQLGEPIWGMPTYPTNVLYIELDTPGNLIANRFDNAQPPFLHKFTLIVESLSWDYRNFLSPAPPAESELIMHTLMDLHRKYDYGVVFIDALREVVLGDLSASGLARRVYDAFKTIFPKSALVFIHHERKSGQSVFGGGDPLQSAAGSMEFINVAQVALRFHRKGRDTWLEHGKSQASAEFEPLPISLREDGVYTYHRELERYQAAVTIMEANPGLEARKLDKLIGEALHMSERTARIVRCGILQAQGGGGGEVGPTESAILGPGDSGGERTQE